MITDPLLSAALRHWGARTVPFSDQPGETAFPSPAWEQAFALVLVGDLYLHDTLRLQQHKALYSRIGAHYQLAPLERSQVEAYLVHGLRQVGIERPILAPAALDLLASVSVGLPRLLNLLARTAWLAAAQAGLNSIGPEQVQA